MNNPRLNDSIKESAPVLKQLILLYQKACREDQEDLKIWADYALHWACRRLDAFLTRTLVSEAAAKIAQKKELGDISLYKWDDQKSMMKDPKRSIFHYEHIYPVSTLRHALEKLDPVTDEAILQLVSQIDIAWITKEECRELGAHGRKGETKSHAEIMKEKGIKYTS